jgi:hypothetical protein
LLILTGRINASKREHAKNIIIGTERLASSFNTVINIKLPTISIKKFIKIFRLPNSLYNKTDLIIEYNTTAEGNNMQTVSTIEFINPL